MEHEKLSNDDKLREIVGLYTQEESEASILMDILREKVVFQNGRYELGKIPIDEFLQRQRLSYDARIDHQKPHRIEYLADSLNTDRENHGITSSLNGGRYVNTRNNYWN